MRKIIYLLSFMVCMFCAQIGSAQLEGVQIGGGLAYGTEISNVGINVMGVLEFNETWEGAPSFTYFFEKDLVTWWEINLDAHYVFEGGDGLYYYPLAGLNITGVTIDVPAGFFGGSVTGTDVGFNIGGGLEKDFSDVFSGVVELKFVLSGSDQLVAKVGGLYRIQ